MSTDDHDIVERIFHAACDIEADGRVAFVREQTDSPQVQAEVLALLRAHESEESLLAIDPSKAWVLPRLTPSSPNEVGDRDTPQPDRLGPYVVLAEIGRGGMGVVYLAHDPRLDRRVAVKVLVAESRQPAFVEHLQREARLFARLAHPSIVTVHDVGDHDGLPYLVMEYVDGESLRQRLGRGRLSVAEAVRVGSAIASGLAHAHTHNVAHGDIKPGNILLTVDGSTKIADFGLAHVFDRGEIGTHLRGGTPGAMSPEQVRGEPASPASDVWSLGVVLYECLTGRKPFPGETDAEMLEQVLRAAPVPPSKLQPKMPARLDTLVLRCLEKNPLQRVPSARAALEELSRTGAQLQRRTRRRVWVASAVAAGALVGATVLAPGLRNQGSPPADPVLAVVDFQDLTQADDATVSAGITGLVQMGLVQSSPIRVVSATHLNNLRRRLYAGGRGTIEEDQALELARNAGASLLLWGQIGATAQDRYVTWHLIAIAGGRSIAADRAEGQELDELADEVVTAVLPLIARAAGQTETPPAAAVADLTTESPRAFQRYVAGVLALEADLRGKGLRELQQAVELDSTFALAHLELAQFLYFTPQDWVPAQRHAERAWVHRTRLNIRDRMRLEALRANLDGRVSDAMMTRREMLVRWPDDCDVIVGLARNLEFNWQVREAAELLDQTRDFCPGDQRIATSRRGVLANSDRFDEFLNLCRADVARDRRSPFIWSELGRAYWYLGLPDSAEGAFTQALSIEPRFAYAQAGLAWCDLSRGDVDEGIRKLEAILGREDLQPSERGLLINQGWYPSLPLLYFQTGRIAKAFGLCEASPVPEDAWICSARVLLDVGRPGDALDVVRNRATGKFDLVDTLELKGRALVLLDSLEAAREVVRQLHEAADRWGGYAAFVAGLLGAQIAIAENDGSAALALLDGMEQKPPQGGSIHAEWLETRVRACRSAGLPEETLRTLEKLLRIYPYRATTCYDLGRLYDEMGRSENAIDAYARFLEMWSDADEGRPQVAYAENRLNALRSTKPRMP